MKNTTTILLIKGNVAYEFIDPLTDETKEQEAIQNGIQPVLVNMREKDQVKQQKIYMGAVLQMGDQTDVIPFIQPGAAMEYSLSRSIKKLAVIDKPAVGLVQGHGEPGLQEMAQVYQELSILYSFQLSGIEHPVQHPTASTQRKYSGTIQDDCDSGTEGFYSAKSLCSPR